MYYFNRRENHKSGELVRGRPRRCKVRIRFTVPSQEAKAVAPLSPTLGQFGLTTSDFCKQFNEQSANYPAGLLLTVDLDVFIDRTFKFRIHNYHLSDLIHSIETGPRNRLLILDFYRLVTLYTSLFGGRFLSNTRTLVGVIRASKIKIVV